MLKRETIASESQAEEKSEKRTLSFFLCLHFSLRFPCLHGRVRLHGMCEPGLKVVKGGHKNFLTTQDSPHSSLGPYFPRAFGLFLTMSSNFVEGWLTWFAVKVQSELFWVPNVQI